MPPGPWTALALGVCEFPPTAAASPGARRNSGGHHRPNFMDCPTPRRNLQPHTSADHRRPCRLVSLTQLAPTCAGSGPAAVCQLLSGTPMAGSPSSWSLPPHQTSRGARSGAPRRAQRRGAPPAGLPPPRSGAPRRRRPPPATHVASASRPTEGARWWKGGRGGRRGGMVRRRGEGRRGGARGRRAPVPPPLPRARRRQAHRRRQRRRQRRQRRPVICYYCLGGLVCFPRIVPWPALCVCVRTCVLPYCSSLSLVYLEFKLHPWTTCLLLYLSLSLVC